MLKFLRKLFGMPKYVLVKRVSDGRFGIRNSENKFYDFKAGGYGKDLWWDVDSSWIEDSFSQDEEKVKRVFDTLTQNKSAHIEVIEKSY